MDRKSPNVLVAVNHHDTKGGAWIQYGIVIGDNEAEEICLQSCLGPATLSKGWSSTTVLMLG
jgi:hypothetical protein